MRSVVALGLVSLGLVTTACSDGAHHDDGGESYNCAAETRDDEFVVGLTKPGQGNKLSFKLLSATPAPPARNDNTWVVEITSVATGAPVASLAASTTVTPFMPDHNHGTSATVVIEEQPAAGQYQLAPVNLWMPGLWETTIEVLAPAAEPDRVVFAFCIPS